MVCAIFEVVLQKRQKCFKIASGRARLCPVPGQSENFDTRVQPNGVRGSFFVEIFCTHGALARALPAVSRKFAKTNSKDLQLLK